MRAIIELWSRERGRREDVDAPSSVSDLAEGLEISAEETLRLLEQVRAQRAEERQAEEAARQAAQERVEARARLAEAEARLAEAEARRARAEAARQQARQTPVQLTPESQQSLEQADSYKRVPILLIVGALILFVLILASGVRPRDPLDPCGDGMTKVTVGGKDLPCGDPNRRLFIEAIRKQPTPAPGR